MLHPDEVRRAAIALLDHMERGWAIIRPLQIESEALTAEFVEWSRRKGIEDETPAEWVAGYIVLMVTEEFRGISYHCQEELGTGFAGELHQYDFKGEAQTVQRALCVLGIGGE